MSRLVLSILGQAAKPLTTRDIALELLVTRALDKNDQRLLRLMTKRVGMALRIQRSDARFYAGGVPYIPGFGTHQLIPGILIRAHVPRHTFMPAQGGHDPGGITRARIALLTEPAQKTFGLLAGARCKPLKSGWCIDVVARQRPGNAGLIIEETFSGFGRKSDTKRRIPFRPLPDCVLEFTC